MWTHQGPDLPPSPSQAGAPQGDRTRARAPHRARPRGSTLTAATIALAALGLSSASLAQSTAQPPLAPITEKKPAAKTDAAAPPWFAFRHGPEIGPTKRSPFELHVGGYGDLQFAYHDFGANQNRNGGAQNDSRLVFDAARFVLAVEGKMPYEIEFEAEVEFEHGGTGVAQDLSYEEFGEYEEEIAKGGGVLLEELKIKKTFAKHFSVTLGRFYVAMGLLSRYYRPTDYLASTRSEAETMVIPAVWDEMGLQLQAKFDWIRATAQVVNGLDSTGFSSQRWVASGHQSRFELVRATDLAFVGRVDLLPRKDMELGISGYYGGTTRNRPKADLVKECASGDGDTVAPCGYVSAPLLLLDAHAHFRWGPIEASGLVLWGRLDNAEAISARNDRLSNALGVLRSPVSDEALAAWGEVGVNVAPWLGLAHHHRITPYGRVDHYNTMFGARKGLFPNPRFERSVVTGGVSYTLAEALVLKLDGSHRWFGASSLNPENTVRLSAGFTY